MAKTVRGDPAMRIGRHDNPRPHASAHYGASPPLPTGDPAGRIGRHPLRTRRATLVLPPRLHRCLASQGGGRWGGRRWRRWRRHAIGGRARWRHAFAIRACGERTQCAHVLPSDPPTCSVNLVAQIARFPTWPGLRLLTQQGHTPQQPPARRRPERATVRRRPERWRLAEQPPAPSQAAQPLSSEPA